MFSCHVGYIFIDNDARPFDSDRIWTEHFELLVRSILVRADQPAVVVLGHFSVQGAETHGYSGPEVLHSVVAQYYDVPHIRCVL